MLPQPCFHGGGNSKFENCTVKFSDVPECYSLIYTGATNMTFLSHFVGEFGGLTFNLQPSLHLMTKAEMMAELILVLFVPWFLTFFKSHF